MCNIHTISPLICTRKIKMFSWKWKFRKVEIKKDVKEWWQKRSLLMTFLDNKFYSLCRRQGHRNKRGGIKAVLRLSLGWNGKHPLLALCLMCFHRLLCFYSSWPPQGPSCHLCLPSLPLSVFNKRSGHFLLLQSKSSPSSAPHYFLIPSLSSSPGLCVLSLPGRFLSSLLFIFPCPLLSHPFKRTSSYLLPPYPLTGAMELTLKK